MDAVGRMIAIIMAVILIFLFPLQYIAQSQEETMDEVVHAHAMEFTDTARHQGYLTLDMYEKLVGQMNLTGELYDISIEVSHPVSGKEAARAAIGSPIPMLDVIQTSYKNSSSHLDNLTSNTEEEISLFATHTHTADCYNGDAHNHSGSSSYGGGCYTTANRHYHSGNSSSGGGCYTGVNSHTHSNSCRHTHDSSCYSVHDGYYTGSSYSSSCPTCGRSDARYIPHYCSTCDVFLGTRITCSTCGVSGFPRSHTALSCGKDSSSYYCGISEGTSYYLQCGYSDGQVTSYSLSCGKSAGYYYNSGGQQVSPTCNLVVSGIVATNPSQIIIQGETIVTTATATYLDGHIGNVSCTASGFSTNTIGTQTVTLTYSGIVGNARTNGTRTCTISVVVNAANYPTSLTVTPSSTTVYNGTEPSYTIVVGYKNGTTKTITSGYTKTGWSTGAGAKTMTFSYTEGATTVAKAITITVLPNVTQLTVTPSATTVYNGKEPAYTVVLTYENGSAKTITTDYTKTGWSTGAGAKTVTFTYIENNKSVSASIVITVLPNLTSITVTPATQSIARYTNPLFTVRAYYENNTNKVLINGYSITGFDPSKLGSQTVTVSYTENNITKNVSVTVIVQKMKLTCPICETTYELNEENQDTGCPVCSTKPISITASPSEMRIKRGESLPITVKASYANGKMAVITDWTSDYDPNTIGIQEVRIAYMGVYTYISVEAIGMIRICSLCGQNYTVNEDGSDPGCPFCHTEVVSISVAEEHVTIEKHHSLPITVTAIFKDGHTEVVTGWSSDLIPDITGTFPVTIFYQSATDHVMVTVIGDGFIHCPYCGLDYDSYGNPNGCPVCSKTIIRIEAYLRNGGTQVLYKSQPGLRIIVIYRDTHRMQTYTDYTITGYRADVIGFQTVTVHYGSFSTQFTIEVINGPGKIICPKGHEYYLNEDGVDPGCLYCDDSTAKESAIYYYEITYTSDIISTLYEEGIYILTEGDYVTVTVTQRNVSLRSNLRNLFFGTNVGAAGKKYTFGGEVY